MRLFSFQKYLMETPYKSALGKALDFIRNGYALPYSLILELKEQGMTAVEIMQLQARHAPQNFPY